MNSTHTIRFANLNDIEGIMTFIKKYWNNTHILANNIELFKYQYVSDETVNFALAINNVTGAIEGINGFIPYSKERDQYAAYALWKTIKTANPALGIEIMQFIKQNTNFKMFFSNGINEKTINLHKFLGYHVDVLKHYYRLNNIDNYNIAKIVDKRILPVSNKREYSLKQIDGFSAFMNTVSLNYANNFIPHKDLWYLERRFFNHPIYKYKVYAIIDSSDLKTETFLFMREEKTESGIILRIVDFIGNIEKLSHISYEIQKLIDSYNYEYIDFYCYGISNDIMESAGFIYKGSTDKNIIPNYFEPFVQENINIIFFSEHIDRLCLFKADGDQDRPSLIKSER